MFAVLTFQVPGRLFLQFNQSTTCWMKVNRESIQWRRVFFFETDIFSQPNERYKNPKYY